MGRCYYAVGDYENAIKNEREAIRLIPHMQVMQRQLAMFERGGCEKGAGVGGRGSGKVEDGFNCNRDAVSCVMVGTP